jgi:predicted RNA-binding Zn-ribbon protein involved in translation (DUF1610 family)
MQMPIGFRCTGCRSRLHVPKRWAGNTLPCPKCGTRVVVPEAANGTGRHATAEAEPTAFEDKAVERSLASLQAPRVGKPGGTFADESFELPSPDDVDAYLRTGESVHGRISLSRWAIAAYLAVIPVIAVGAFLLGCWWTRIPVE